MGRGKNPDGSPQADDVKIGEAIHHYRTLMGVSMATLGDAIGTSFQQVQKYESGLNRISASRLWQIAKRLDVRVDRFFDRLN